MADYTIPTSPLKRLRYYNNQFLAEKDFIDDQAAHLAHERAHLRAMCSPGVWEGLEVTYATLPTTSAPAVGGGIAVDDQGRLIVLAPVPSGLALFGPAPSTLANGNYVLSIQYNEVATDMSTNTGGAAGTADNTRFTSQPVLAATAATAVPAGAVVLGSFTVTGGQITAKSDAGRQYAGLRLPGPVLAGNPPATLANRNDGSADGVRLSGTLTVQKTSASAIGPSLTLANPNTTPGGGANAGGAIDFNSYDPGTNFPGVRIQSLGDANFSSHLTISTKKPGAIGNALAERLRITSSGTAQFSGPVTAPSLSAPTFAGAVNFTDAVTTVAQLLPTSPAETNMLPLIVNRDYRGNNRSLIDHNGYRMGEVSEIDENWKLAGTRTVRFSAAPFDYIGVTAPNTGATMRLAEEGYQANAVIGPLPAGATITSLVVQYGRFSGVVQFSLDDHSPGSIGLLFVNRIVEKTISTGTGNATTDLAVSPSSGGLPYTVNAQSKLTINGLGNGFADVTGDRGFIVEAFLVTYIMDPPGWAWTPSSSVGALPQFNRFAMRRYQDPTAALGLNQRSVNIASPFKTAQPGEEGSLTTEGYEAFMDANICYVQE